MQGRRTRRRSIKRPRPATHAVSSRIRFHGDLTAFPEVPAGPGHSGLHFHETDAGYLNQRSLSIMASVTNVAIEPTAPASTAESATRASLSCARGKRRRATTSILHPQMQCKSVNAGSWHVAACWLRNRRRLLRAAACPHSPFTRLSLASATKYVLRVCNFEP